MKKRAMYLILPIITLILEILPYGAVCNFWNPEGEPWRKTFSYFDLTPFGYANFAPLLTAIITCLIFVLLVIFCINGNIRTVNIAKIVLCAAIGLSICPLLLGLAYFSTVAALITLSLAAELIFIYLSVKKSNKF